MEPFRLDFALTHFAWVYNGSVPPGLCLDPFSLRPGACLTDAGACLIDAGS